MKFKKLSRFLRLTFFAGVALASQSAFAEVIDILVLYTPEAMATRNGADINARISAYIAYANTAYENSRVDIQLRLVGTQLTDAPYDFVNETNLSSLSRDATVANLRAQTGADVVTLLNLRQSMSGGYVCGIGYIPQGRSDTGQFYSNAPSAGFSLVGIDCGLSTFAHELGHNMGLGHSHQQNSIGGVWPWARGYGVNGLFSTVMAYPQSFATNNQLPVFSNPNLMTCTNLACGVDKTRSDGADAAASLTTLAPQIAAFRPTMIPIVDLPENDVPVSPPTQYCASSAVPNNYINNGEFNVLDGWQSGFGAAVLQIETFSQPNCLENRLVVSQRTAFSSNAAQILRQPLQPNVQYQLRGEFAVRGSAREMVRIALRVRTSRGSYYHYLNPVSATAGELTRVAQNFTVGSGQIDAILIYGPPGGVDIIMDNVSVTKVP